MLLGGSWEVIGGVISPLIWVSIVTALITLLITTHEPPSRCSLQLQFRVRGERVRGSYLKNVVI